MKYCAIVLVPILVFATGIAGATEEGTKGFDPYTGAGHSAEAIGGPDAFGYTWFDQANGCTYSWVALTGAATILATGDDAGGTATLGGTGFDFYGATYTQLQGATNGYISTDATDLGPDWSNDCPIPNPVSSGGGARFYPIHDDLDGDVLHEYFASCPRAHDIAGFGDQGCNVFQWNATYLSGGESVEVQAILYDNVFEIVYQYQSTGQTGSSSTTGIQAEGATDGLLYACNTAASITEGASAVCFEHPFPVPVELQGFSIE